MRRMTIAPIASLDGALVRLRPRRSDDVTLFVRWYNDDEVRHWLHMSEVSDISLESEAARFESAQNDRTRLSWIIETLDGTPIGNVTLVGIDELHKRAELGISIGEKEYWSRGYGTDAVRLGLRFAFENLGLQRVELITDADNARGIRCYEKCGFVTEGTLRNKRLRHGQPIDMLLMSVLREEWGAQAAK